MPQQVRIALFNRALLFAKMGNATGCLEVLDVLRASLLVSYHGDDELQVGKSEGGLASSPKGKKGKKKKAPSTATSSRGNGENLKQVQDVPTAKPASQVEAIAWNARADWLESELYRISESSEEDILSNAIAKLDKASNDKENVNNSGVLSFAKSQLLLHKAAVTNPHQSKALLIEALESLPPSMQSCPGTAVTLASLYASSNNSNKGSESTSQQAAEKLLSSLGDDTPSKLAMAEFHMGRGKYEDAIELLQGIVEEDASSMEAMALLVKALSYTDPSKAEEYVGLLQEAMEVGPELDGEALESMEIPRFAKKALGSSTSSGGGGEGAGGSSSKVRKMIAATGGKRGSNLG